MVKLVRVKPDLMAQSTETLISLGSPWEEEEDSSNEKVVVPVGNNILTIIHCAAFSKKVSRVAYLVYSSCESVRNLSIYLYIYVNDML